MHLDPGLPWPAIRDRFVWDIPARFNIAWAVCDRHCEGADGGETATAILQEEPDGTVRRFSFADLKRASCRLANTLAGRGVGRGDRVGVLLGQQWETAVAHVAALRLGAITVPLFTLFGLDALRFRLGDCGARALITDAAQMERVAGLLPDLPDLATVICLGAGSSRVGAPDQRVLDWAAAMAAASDVHGLAETGPDDPAVIIYTSGTTGKPKGALHGHRVLPGHMPGVELPQRLFPQPGDLFWTPADWAWIGGLIDVLWPSLLHGVPVLAQRAAKFDPEAALALMARHGCALCSCRPPR